MDTSLKDSLSTDSSEAKAQHLCVIIHGLWGNSKHLDYVAKSLQKEHGEDELIVYSAKRNTGSLTYDGIEIGAERVTKEIEEVLEQLTRDGHSITKFSVVGYSLGGLVARYVIGLLWNKRFFDKISPINFTTFATPHLGVRTPLTGYQNHGKSLDLSAKRRYFDLPAPLDVYLSVYIALTNTASVEHFRRKASEHLRSTTFHNRRFPRHGETFT